MPNSFFCLDLGENLIKLSDLNTSGGQLDANILSYGEGSEMFYQSESEKEIEKEAQLIEKLVSSNKITKKNVNIIVPDTITYSQILEMPKLNEKELISAIRYQADQFIPMPIEEANLDLEILSENVKDNSILVIMVAAPKKAIEKIQKTVELAGLVPESIENELSSTSRFMTAYFSKLYPKTNDGSLIVNLGFNSTTLYYYDVEKNLTLQIHTFNIGYSLFIKELVINLSTDSQKAIEILKMYAGQQTVSVPVNTIIAPIMKEFDNELRNFINLIADKYKKAIKNIFVINDGFRFSYLPVHLKSNFSIQTELFNPYPLFKPSKIVESSKHILPLLISTIGGNLR